MIIVLNEAGVRHVKGGLFALTPGKGYCVLHTNSVTGVVTIDNDHGVREYLEPTLFHILFQ